MVEPSCALRSALMILICKISNRGSQIPEPLLMFNSKRPLKVQISRGLGPFFHIELLKLAVMRSSSNARNGIASRSSSFKRTCLIISERERVAWLERLLETKRGITPNHWTATAQLGRLLACTRLRRRERIWLYFAGGRGQQVRNRPDVKRGVCGYIYMYIYI